MPVLLALFVALPAAAETHTLVLLPFIGPNAAVSRGQLVKELCGGEVTCVPWKRVVTGTRPDFRKVRRAGVDLVLTGRVTGPEAQRVLEVTVHDASGEIRFEARHPLARNGKVSRTGMADARARVLEAFGPGKAAAAPAPLVEAQQPQLVPEPSVAPATAPTAEPPFDGDIRILPLLPPEPLFFVEVGTDFTNRNYTYVGLAEENLRAYETRPLMFSPRVQAGVYPLARILDGLPARVGIEGSYASAVGLRSTDENEGRHTTTFRELDVGARVDLYPFGATKPMISTQLGYRSSTFEVGPADDGTRLEGMPHLAYDLLRAGVAVEGQLSAMRLFGRVSYLHALGLGEIGTTAYFPESGASGLEAELGAGYALTSQLQLRVAARYTRYGLSFDPDPGAVYRAEGAADRYLGGTLGVRFVY